MGTFSKKPLLSRGAKLIRVGMKQSCAKGAALFRSASFPIFGIPSGLVSLEESVVPIYDKIELLWQSPKTLGRPPLSQFNLEKVQVSDGVMAVPNATATRLGGNLNSSGKLIVTLLQPIDGKAAHQHDLFRFSTKRFFPRIYKTQDPVLTLAAGWQGAFFHWIYEVLPRLHLAEKGGYHSQQIYIEAATSFQKESLALLGITSFINAKEYDAVQTPKLIIPSVPSIPTPWICQFLREKFLSSIEKKPSHRLYLSRNDASKRRIVNEEEVLKVLKKYGFQKLEMSKLSFKDQMQAFHSAEIVIAPHGAGLSHLVFCQPQTPVLEIFAPEYVNVCYWHVCNQVGLPYHYLFGKGVAEGNVSHDDPDILVEIDQLTAMLKLMGC